MDGQTNEQKEWLRLPAAVLLTFVAKCMVHVAQLGAKKHGHVTRL
jgi:hypothetical protein